MRDIIIALKTYNNIYQPAIFMQKCGQIEAESKIGRAYFSEILLQGNWKKLSVFAGIKTVKPFKDGSRLHALVLVFTFNTARY